MTKITLDRETFKALASDTRLDILKNLDGKKMSLTDIIAATNLNKATLHEHLTKLHEAGLVKKHEREGHKWVYYQLSWKGESLLHPENTRIVVLFTTTFVALWVGILQLIWYVKGTVTSLGYSMFTEGENLVVTKALGAADVVGHYSTQLTNSAPAFPSGIKSVLGFLNGKAFPTGSWSAPFNPNIDFLRDLSVNSGVYDSSLPPQTEGSRLIIDKSSGIVNAVYQDPLFLYIAIACFLLFTVALCAALWRAYENRTQKL